MATLERLDRVMNEGDTLKLECRDCGHRARWSRRKAIAVFGPDAGPFEVRKLASCGKCRSHNITASI